jgi:hypothetical protein
MEETTFWESVAVTETALSVVGAKARQISEEPLCAFVKHNNPTRRTVRLPLAKASFESSRGDLSSLRMVSLLLDLVGESRRMG